MSRFSMSRSQSDSSDDDEVILSEDSTDEVQEFDDQTSQFFPSIQRGRGGGGGWCL